MRRFYLKLFLNDLKFIVIAFLYYDLLINAFCIGYTRTCIY